jgi:pimeloyl-ACP methyl ester carboxylesterase
VKGITWVLLRGLTREQRHWGEFLELFRRSMPGCRVVAMDLPGTGQLNEQRSPWTMQATAQGVRAALRARGEFPPYHVLAISMGAMVATSWAVQYPGEIDAAVLINTSMRPFSPFWQRLQPHNYLSIARMMMPEFMRNDPEATTLRMTSRLRSRDFEVLRAWVRYRGDRPIARIDAVAQLWMSARFRAPQSNPFTRLILLTSTRDSIVDTQCSIALSTAWGCKLSTHPQAGHDLPLDDPQWVIDAVRGWVDSE